MVKSNSTSRLLSINKQVILTQTDTTVGFLSQDSGKLAGIKTRPSTKPFIKVYDSLHTFKQQNQRIPNKFKRTVRLAKKTTFIVKNESFRIAPTPLHSAILRSLHWSFSTSANESGKKFERSFCESKADIIIEDRDTLREEKASTLLKINHKKIKRLR